MVSPAPEDIEYIASCGRDVGDAVVKLEEGDAFFAAGHIDLCDFVFFDEALSGVDDCFFVGIVQVEYAECFRLVGRDGGDAPVFVEVASFWIDDDRAGVAAHGVQ